MSIKSFCGLLMLSLILSCSSSVKKEEKAIESEKVIEKTQSTDSMIGKWDSKILKVTKVTVNNTGDTEIIDANPENYEEVVGLKTAVVYFNEDSTYKEEYILPDGSIAYEQSGKWYLEGDSLTTIVYGKDIQTYKYHIILKGDSAYFSSLMDYDADGEQDDEFYGVSVRSKDF